MFENQVVNQVFFEGAFPSLKIAANIAEDVSGERIKCTDFEGFTPTG
jgi:hypothetical protein